MRKKFFKMNETDCTFKETIDTEERKYEIGTCYTCQKCLYCGVNLTCEENKCSCDKSLKPTNSKTKKLQSGYVRNGVYDPHKSHSVLVTLLQSSNDLYGYNSNFSKKFNYTLCAKCNSQLARDQNAYNKNKPISTKRRNLTTTEPFTASSNELSELNNSSSLNTPFRFKLIIKTPDSTKPAKAIALEKNPDDYYEFDDIVLQKVCETVGLLVRSEYELSYKAEKGVGAGTVLEEEEDFEEFMREYHRLISSNKVLLLVVTIQKKEPLKRKKVLSFIFLKVIIIIIY